MASAEPPEQRAGILYVDTSALLKLLVREAESTAIERELVRWPSLATSIVTEVELPRAVARARQDRPDAVIDGSLILQGVIASAAIIELTEDIVIAARSVAPVHVGALDAIHIATDSPWDPGLVLKAVAERVASEIDVEAWVLDDTGFPKQGMRSPGVKRQYSGTLGKVGNCQIGVSVHAVGKKGTVPLGWALYLPEEWCRDQERRRTAKIPEEVLFKTKPALGVRLIERALSWEVPAAPVLGDAAYGDNTELREGLHDTELEYVLSVSAQTTVFAPGTVFGVPERKGATGRPRGRLRPESKPVAIGKFIAGLHPEEWQTVAFRDRLDSEPMISRFAFVRVRAAHLWQTGYTQEPREEYLICEWPEGQEKPTDYWISNLPADTPLEQLARLARMRWKIELDYKQLKGELGLDHYEGRSYLGWYHHTAMVTAAHAFLTLERLHPFRQRPA